MYSEIYSTVVTPAQFQAINHLACAWVIGAFIYYHQPESGFVDRWVASVMIVLGSLIAIGF